MFYSYFVKYTILGCGFLNESEIVIYTNKKILTNAQIIKVEDEMYNQYKKMNSLGTGIKIETISFLGEVSKREASNDEYMVYPPLNLSSD